MTYLKTILSLLLIAGFTTLMSCKDDEVPVATVSLASTAEETSESDGTAASFHPDFEDILEEDAPDGYGFTGVTGAGKDMKVTLVFDRELAGEAVLAFTVAGSASSENPSDEFDVNDYEILQQGEGLTVSGDNITIAKGTKEASLIIRVYEDFEYEFDSDENSITETIEVTINSVVSGPVNLATPLTYTLTITEDDTILFLDWKVDGSTTVADVRRVNMDLFVWLDGYIIAGSAYANDEFPQGSYPFEYTILQGGFPDGEYLLTYNYKTGDSDNVEFAASFYGHLNGDFYPFTQEDDQEVGNHYIQYTGTYTQTNVNDYEVNEYVRIVQSMEKDGLNFDISDIEIPDEGSRIRTTPTRGVSIRSLQPKKIAPKALLHR